MAFDEFACAIFLFSYFFSSCHLPLYIIALLDCRTGLATLISSSAVPDFSPSIPHSSLPSLVLPLLGIQAQTEREKKLAVRHIPLLPSLCLLLSTLQRALLSLPSSSPPSVLSPPHYFPLSLLCLVAPLIHYISTPLLLPPLTPPSFFSGS